VKAGLARHNVSRAGSLAVCGGAAMGDEGNSDISPAVMKGRCMADIDTPGKGARPSVVTPTGVERMVGADDIIVSETDPKGIITFANDTFARIAAYRVEELLDQPHNIVRHPDMPRCVFKLLWDTIEAGQEISAYVVNLAGDGAHYWVFAHVAPVKGPDGSITGYRSERRAPSRGAVDAVAAVYAQLLATEQAAASTKAGIEASTAQLMAVLAERGQSYDEFLQSLA
jgi:PAS domain S-box-containing protein